MKHYPGCRYTETGNISLCWCPGPKERHLYTRAFVLALIAGAIEIYGVYLAGSVALLSDIVHIGADALSYFSALSVMALIAVFASLVRPATIVLVWFELLLLIFGDWLVFSEAVKRIFEPQEVLGLPTLIAALAGLGLNLAVVIISRRTPKHEQNIRHASVDAHAVSDLAVSIAVILAAALIWLTDITATDWIVALGVGYYLLLGPIWGLAHKIIHGKLRPHELAHTHSHGHGHGRGHHHKE